ncbi:MAG: hypothetical protein NXH97_12310 [Rhodobacteraceae bacterium]|nr:hypothetical protein [Paracoccaceae bacterium]
MNTTVKMLAAAALAMAVAMPVSAQNAGESMLLSAVKNELSGMDVTDEQIDALSLNDLVSIQTILTDPDENANTKRNKVMQVIDSAN